MGIPVPVIPLELPSYQRKENFGADETFFQIVRALAKPMEKTARVTANLIGPTGLGFRHRDDTIVGAGAGTSPAIEDRAGVGDSC